MALWDEVKARYPLTFLTQISNAESPGSPAPLDALGLKAQSDVQADMLTFAGWIYSDSDARHVSVGIVGVLKKLHLFRGLPADEDRKERQEWIDTLKGLAQSRGVSRVKPTCNSRFTPSIPNPDGAELEPPFDADRFQGLIPNEPVN